MESEHVMLKNILYVYLCGFATSASLTFVVIAVKDSEILSIVVGAASLVIWIGLSIMSIIDAMKDKKLSLNIVLNMHDE